MGEIFLAKHGLSGFEKLCVIKKVLPQLSRNEHFIGRFVNEAQVTIKLQHANIAQVYEVGRVGDEYFLAIEYVEGRDLRRTLAMLAERGERLPPVMALLIARDIANGLAYAHRRTTIGGELLELVHCDISPPNVMVSFEGEIKLIDFGIAKSALSSENQDPNVGFGKIGYMAPEQLVRGGTLDPRTDIYATGAVLFEMLTGQRLFEQNDSSEFRALAKRVLRGEHPLPSDVEPTLVPYDSLVAKALHPRPAERFDSAQDLRHELQSTLVQLDPIISSDVLGELMRGLFADEMEAQRRLASHALATDLRVWEAELSGQSSATVSFARASRVIAIPDQAAPPPPPVADAPLPPELDDPPIRQHTALTTHRQRRKAWLIVLGSVVLLAVGVLMTMFLVPGPTIPARETLAAGSAEASDAGAGDIPVDAAALPRSSPPDQPSGDEVSGAATGEKAADTAEPRPSTRSPESPVSTGQAEQAPGRSRQPALDGSVTKRSVRTDVEAKFRAVAREYGDFKKHYGGRLEAEWSDLAQEVQFRQASSNLAGISRKLDRFRSQMRTIKSEHD